MPVNKKLLSVLLVLTMLISVVSCGRNDHRNYQNPWAVDEINFKEPPVTITYLTIGDKPENGRTEDVIERLNAILLKKLNAKLDIFYVSWDDYLRKYNETISSDDISIDLIGTGTDWLDAWPNVINGNFMPITEDMIKQYCGITYTNVTNAQWKDCTYEGNIYFIPENEYTQWTNHGFVYRMDFAHEAGLNDISPGKILRPISAILSMNIPR